MVEPSPKPLGRPRPTLEEWRRDGWAAEAPSLADLARAALAAAPSPDSVRDLSIGARALAGSLDEKLRARAIDHVKVAFETKKDDALFDALVVCADLSLAEVRPTVLAILSKDGPKTPWVRGMAAWAMRGVAPAAEAKTILDRTRREDVSWVARNIAGEAALVLDGRPDSTPPLFARFGWLQKTYRLKTRSHVAPYGVEKWLKLGVALPPAPRLFYAQVLGGGTCDLADEGAGSEVTRRGQLTLRAPEDAPRPAPPLTELSDYVWKRYVDHAKSYPSVDEEQALRRYAERYDDPRRPLDRDAWAYGVLLFEGAFRDEAKRADRLLRAREVLEGTIAITGEADWDVVADRLAEARDMIQGENLATLPRTPRLFPFGTFSGLELFLDAARAGATPVLARPVAEEEEEDEFAPTTLRALRGPKKEPALVEPTEISPSFARWMADPRGANLVASVTASAETISLESVGRGGEGSALLLLSEAQRFADQKDMKRAGRLYFDALDLESGKEAVEAVARFLERPEVEPALAADLLGETTLGGDKKGEKIAHALLAELDVARGKEIVAALEKLDRAGGGDSGAARLVDVIAKCRPKRLEALRDAARAIQERRGEAHVRTVKNKWYKPFKKDL